MKRRKLLGDFQTPLPFAREIVSHLFADGRTWERILEPTCGLGNFIRAFTEQSQNVREIIGLEIQRHYVEESQKIFSGNTRISIIHQDIFEADLTALLRWNRESPLLIVGNPPWVTIAEQGRMDGSNLPKKSNFQRQSGFDAITGKSNFDIAEAIWLKLMREYFSDPVTIALLGKTSVARKVARFALQNKLPVNRMSLYHVDAKKWFNVAVDAGLFVLEQNQGDLCYDVEEYESLASSYPARSFGFSGEEIVADLHAYRQVSFVDGKCSLVWRQGVKHDASKIMELTCNDGILVNGYGEVVDVESDYLYPLIKSSDVSTVSSGFVPRKYVLVTQRKLGQSTTFIQDHAPKLWRYLNKYADRLDARKSTIYRNVPRFSMFGIGEYCFAPYKVAVSGFYLPPRFVLISSYKGKVIFLDDTCYFLSFQEKWEALIVAGLLNHPTVAKFLNSIVFPDSKRPITKSLLKRINLHAIYESVDLVQLLDSVSDTEKSTTPLENLLDTTSKLYLTKQQRLL
ncbi:MAG: SAM-dependent methyltransferase [Chloroflexi bacterium]|nr:SAM-dependent methyltransferase [Chloroflexota bacterium]